MFRLRKFEAGATPSRNFDDCEKVEKKITTVQKAIAKSNFSFLFLMLCFWIDAIIKTKLMKKKYYLFIVYKLLLLKTRK